MVFGELFTVIAKHLSALWVKMIEPARNIATAGRSVKNEFIDARCGKLKVAEKRQYDGRKCKVGVAPICPVCVLAGSGLASQITLQLKTQTGQVCATSLVFQ